MSDLEWLDNYSGETTDELLSLEGKYRIDSLILAFEQGIDQKAAREGFENISGEERIVLAIEAFEREVNNGGYEQFLLNSPEFAPIIVESLGRIVCQRTAVITQNVLDALNFSQISSEEIENIMQEDNDERDQVLFRFDNQFFARSEDIEGHLFAFIKENKSKIRL